MLHGDMISTTGGGQGSSSPSKFSVSNKATPRSNNASPEALEEKTKAELAKLQSDTAAPSSFVEEGAPDSFADLDAKLKVRDS